MPAIKKRITAEYLEREQQRSEQNGGSAGDVEGARENSPPPPAPPPMTAAGAASPLKRKALGTQGMLKGLDGEVLVEKRKRTLPPGESKLDAWLDNNLEKRADSALSLVKLYQFYTDMCQQDASNVVEMDVFKNMLHNKFGKEFGLREGSAYSGLVKTSKPRKKAVVAQSLGYKMKDIIEEALKSSGNPSKGVMFGWLKKYISAKYPALQIEFRPHFLRKALEREIYAGRVELVKGIGFCGYYRQPGPPAVEEEPKQKKKGAKKEKQGGESADSADDAAVETDKDTEAEKAKGKTDEKGDETAETTVKDKKKKSKEKEEGSKETEEGKEGEEEKKTEEKKAKKKRKRAPRRTAPGSARHSNPQMLNDVFPLAMTYMAEPKEASFARIRKYLEKFYGQVDVDAKLKRCIEHGCEIGMWDRVSGSGASGSFQLQVDSFNPEHTESMNDMVCSAIIACNEPKTASVRLLKNYISEYHPEFNIDTRPHKLKFALERAEKQNQLRRVSGIGMTGSFQLVEHFTPSPSILAGEEDDEESEYEEAPGKEEVYVVRKTKSGRRAPLERTQFDFSPSHRKKAGKGGGGGARRKVKQKKASRKSQYAEVSSEEEESSSEEEADSDVEGYRPRPSKSRGGGGRAAPAKANKQRAAPKAKGKAAVTKGRGRPAVKTQSPPKRGKPARKSPQKRQAKDIESEEEEEVVENKQAYTPRPTKSGRNANGSTPIKSPAKKRGTPRKAAAPVSDDEEEYYEVEEEETPSPPKKRSPGKVAVRKSPAAVKKSPAATRRAVESSTPSEGRTPRSASRTARQSYKEADSEVESDEDRVTTPKSSRASRKR